MRPPQPQSLHPHHYLHLASQQGSRPNTQPPLGALLCRRPLQFNLTCLARRQCLDVLLSQPTLSLSPSFSSTQ
uniref:Ovule protein n=1 Tax=Mesocestoides corti TaxID=53468 RepID=A0A5K3G3E2_MESCO